MNIKSEFIWAIILGLTSIIGILVGMLHKDLKSSIDKISDSIETFWKEISKIVVKIEEHDKKHDNHDKKHEELKASIEDLKKNVQHQDIRITKIEDKF